MSDNRCCWYAHRQHQQHDNGDGAADDRSAAAQVSTFRKMPTAKAAATRARASALPTSGAAANRQRHAAARAQCCDALELAVTSS
jgi:hypothetical protein